MAEELAPIIGQIEALDTFLRCDKEEDDAILTDKDRLERELYAYGRASDALLGIEFRSLLLITSCPDTLLLQPFSF